jgi:hypothetical protein
MGDRSMDRGDSAGEALGPDPVTGAGIALLGIFLMAIGGARDAHYVFDVGVLIALVGAVAFVACVVLSAMKQRAARAGADAPEGDAARGAPPDGSAGGKPRLPSEAQKSADDEAHESSAD